MQKNSWSDTKNWFNQLNGWDSRSARFITDFKKDYILSIGDLMNRSICMAIAGGATYKLASYNNPSLIRRTRNLAASFLLSGWLFVPELFNPFLPKIDWLKSYYEFRKPTLSHLRSTRVLLWDDVLRELGARVACEWCRGGVEVADYN